MPKKKDETKRKGTIKRGNSEWEEITDKMDNFFKHFISFLIFFYFSCNLIWCQFVERKNNKIIVSSRKFGGGKGLGNYPGAAGNR